MNTKQRAFGLTVALVAAISSLTLLVLVFTDYAAHAATITVNTTADELNADGDCSLREAIEAANTDAPVDACSAGQFAPVVDTITFSVTGTITLTSGQLRPINVTIDGPGAESLTISGNNTSRVFETIGTVNLRDVTVADGFVDTQLGGGAGLLNLGNLTVTDSIFTGNSVVSHNTGLENGGGILSFGFGTASVTNTTFSGNSAGSGGGISLYGSGALTVTDSTFSANSAAGGGGLSSFDGRLTVANTTFSGNSASFNGGGILYFHILDLVGTVKDSTFSGNSAGSGGGIYAGNSLSVINSTFAGNTATEGGGVFSDPFGTLTVTNSTLSGNSAAIGGGIGIFPVLGAVTLRNTIVANSPSGGNCSEAPTDGGGNLQHPGTDCGPTITSADPLLDPAGLQNNGGPTETIALQPGSPAIDSAAACPPPSTDQRSVARPQGAACDIGAFELEQGTTTPSPTPTPTCPVDDIDFDDDGISNRRDKDDDGDDIRDGPDPDDDNDGIRDSDDPDDDNDGILDNKDKDDGQSFCP